MLRPFSIFFLFLQERSFDLCGKFIILGTQIFLFLLLLLLKLNMLSRGLSDLLNLHRNFDFKLLGVCLMHHIVLGIFVRFSWLLF